MNLFYLVLLIICFSKYCRLLYYTNHDMICTIFYKPKEIYKNLKDTMLWCVFIIISNLWLKVIFGSTHSYLRKDANKEKISSVECLFKSFADYQLFWISPWYLFYSRTSSCVPYTYQIGDTNYPTLEIESDFLHDFIVRHWKLNPSCI